MCTVLDAVATPLTFGAHTASGAIAYVQTSVAGVSVSVVNQPGVARENVGTRNQVDTLCRLAHDAAARWD
jgi:hypothetical protein